MKKKIVGIVAEYNPFHNGHLYHLEESLKLTEADVSIVAMSGNFVQRGGVAVADKWARAEAAVRCGVDIVVEIPTVFSCSSAQNFAAAGVEILENLGADFISFGSESGNIADLKKISLAIKKNHLEIENAVKQKSKSGLSYPRARRSVIAEMFGEQYALLLDTPNNILALEYIRSMKKAVPVTVRRTGPGYNDTYTSENFASATAIRDMIERNEDVSPYIPESSANILKSAPHIDMDKLFIMLCHKVLDTAPDILERAPAGGEGLGNKIKSSIRKCKNMDQLAEELKSKRYTRTRIDRFLMQILLSLDRDRKAVNYTRILGLSSNGSKYVKELKKSGYCSIPLLTNINREKEDCKDISYMLDKDILAADLYNIAAGRNLYDFSEYVRKPYTEGKS